jgi:hypothetical protein
VRRYAQKKPLAQGVVYPFGNRSASDNVLLIKLGQTVERNVPEPDNPCVVYYPYCWRGC